MATKRTDASRPARYRVLAAEAHSWSSLLLEDERGQRYLFVVGPGTLTKLADGAVDDLLARRTYRPWRGDRSWVPLHQLPLTKQTAGLVERPDLAAALAEETHQTEV